MIRQTTIKMKILKELRRKNKLTLREVETKTGISNSYLSQLENGLIKNPSIHIICELAKLYNVTVNELVDEIEAINKLNGAPPLKQNLLIFTENEARDLTELKDNIDTAIASGCNTIISISLVQRRGQRYNVYLNLIK